MKAVSIKGDDGYTTTMRTNAAPGSILHEVCEQAEKHPEMMGGRPSAKDTPAELVSEVMDRNQAIFRSYLLAIGKEIEKIENDIAKKSEKLIGLKEEREEIEVTMGCNLEIKAKMQQLTFNFGKAS